MLQAMSSQFRLLIILIVLLSENYFDGLCVKMYCNFGSNFELVFDDFDPIQIIYYNLKTTYPMQKIMTNSMVPLFLRFDPQFRSYALKTTVKL